MNKKKTSTATYAARKDKTKNHSAGGAARDENRSLKAAFDDTLTPEPTRRDGKKTTTIERIIDKEPVPEMVFHPRSKKAEVRHVPLDEVPEVVLPKTKAEVVEEAQKRLSERDPLEKRKTKTQTRAKTETPVTSEAEKEDSLKKTVSVKSTQTRTAQSRADSPIRTVRLADNVRERIMTLRKIVDSPKIVGNPEDMVPFSWRQPLKLEKDKKMSRVFKTMTAEERARALLVPVRSDDNR